MISWGAATPKEGANLFYSEFGSLLFIIKLSSMPHLHVSYKFG